MNERVQPQAADLYAPGIWRCARCEFRLVQSNLNMGDGSITANDKPGEKCPNCNGPLWRVSWKDEAREAYAIAEQQCDRAVKAENDLKDYVSGVVRERDAIIEECARAAEQQERIGYEWVHNSLWANILKRAGDNVRRLKRGSDAALVENPVSEAKS